MLEDLKFTIPQETLTQTIESLRELALRLEIDASAFALIHSRESALLAEERLEQAETVRQLFEFYLHL